MGNCCGSQSNYDYDDPTPASTRPQKARVRVSGPGHTLGGPADTSAGADPRTAAALAAEQRNLSMGKGGKLASQLAADRGKSRQQHLMDASVQRQTQQQNLQWD